MENETTPTNPLVAGLLDSDFDDSPFDDDLLLAALDLPSEDE